MAENILRIIMECEGVRIKPPETGLAEHWVIGKPVDLALETLPRIFNLCQSAQKMGLMIALDHIPDPKIFEALQQEILSDHQFNLFFYLPKILGRSLDKGDYDQALGILTDGLLQHAPRVLDVRFSKAKIRGLMIERVLAKQQEFGLVDFMAARILEAKMLEDGAEHLQPKQVDDWVVIPASRGEYHIRASQIEGMVNRFERRTPTDRMLAEHGLLAALMAALPAPSARELEIAMAVIDPCFEVQIEERYAHA